MTFPMSHHRPTRAARPAALPPILVAAVLLAVSAPPAAAAPTYADDIEPLLREHCFNCHNPDKKEGDLDLTTYKALMAGAGSFPVVDTEENKAEYSTLYLLMAHVEEPHMPPEKPKLPTEDLNLVKEWIEAGAPERIKITYDDHVKPIFREHCFECHGSSGPEADLNLELYSTAMTGASSGPVISPGSPDSSKLYAVISHQATPFMPQNRPKIPTDQIETIRQWIAGGVLENADSKPKGLGKAQTNIVLSMPEEGERPEPTMPGTLLMEPVVHTERDGQATALAHSPWAPLAAVGGQHQIILYHSGTREMLGVLPLPEGFARSLRFSRNGKYLLAGGGYGARQGLAILFDVQTGERITAVGDEYDSVLAADINARQTLIALGGPGKIVKTYATQTGELQYRIEKHTEWITALGFSPDGVLLATGDRNGGLHVWEGPTGRPFYDLDGHDGAITAIAWRPDSNAFASAGEDGAIKLWNMIDGSQIRSWNAHGGGVLDVRFTHDGRIVSAGRDKQVKTWKPDGSALKTLGPFPDLALTAVFNHDGTRVIAGDWTGQLRVWETESGSHLGDLSTNPPTLAARITQANKALAEHKSKFGDPAATLAAAKRAAQKAEADLAAAKQRKAELETTAPSAAAGAKQAEAIHARLTAELAAARERHAEAEAEAGRLKTAAAEAESTLEKERTVLAQAEQPPADQTQKIEAAEDALESAQAEAAKARREADAARQAMEQKTAELAKADAERTAAAQAAEKARAEIESLNSSLPALEKKNEPAKQQIAAAEKAAAERAALQEDLARLQTAQVHADLYHAKKELTDHQATREATAADLAAAQVAAAQAAAEAEQTKAALAAAKAAAEAKAKAVQDARARLAEAEQALTQAKAAAEAAPKEMAQARAAAEKVAAEAAKAKAAAEAAAKQAAEAEAAVLTLTEKYNKMQPK